MDLRSTFFIDSAFETEDCSLTSDSTSLNRSMRLFANFAARCPAVLNPGAQCVNGDSAKQLARGRQTDYGITQTYFRNGSLLFCGKKSSAPDAAVDRFVEPFRRGPALVALNWSKMKRTTGKKATAQDAARTCAHREKNARAKNE